MLGFSVKKCFKVIKQNGKNEPGMENHPVSWIRDFS
jgi:hypothetical protein